MTCDEKIIAMLSEMRLAMLDVLAAWIYTRSFPQVPLLNAKNLTVNLSADRDNLNAAIRCARENGYLHRICYLWKKGDRLHGMLAPGDVIFPDYSLRGDREWLKSLPHTYRSMVCPPDFVGQSDRARCGPCTRCM